MSMEVRFASPRRRNFTQIDNHILNDMRLSVQARFLYLHLLQFAWHTDQSQGVFPSQETLANRMRMRPRMLRIYIDELVRSGLVRVERRGKMKTNIYTLFEDVCADFVGLPWPPDAKKGE